MMIVTSELFKSDALSFMGILAMLTSQSGWLLPILKLAIHPLPTLDQFLLALRSQFHLHKLFKQLLKGILQWQSNQCVLLV